MDYLQHHGIEGQKWGVRHGPPYPIERGASVRIKKGTHIQRLSLYDERSAKGHAYVTYLTEDNEHYKGFFASILKTKAKLKSDIRSKLKGKSDVYEVSLTAKEDLISPSKNTRLKTFLELYKKDKLIAKNMGDYYKDDYRSITPLSKKFYEEHFSKLSDTDLKKEGFDVFNRAIGGNKYIRKKYFNALSEKGYNFVQDDLDSGKIGREPSIVFDRAKSLSYEGQTELKGKNIVSNFVKYGIFVKK